MKIVEPKFTLGAIVRHRVYDFRSVVFDINPEFANTEEWYRAIPAEIRPRRDQPFYHLLAENPQSYYTAYVSEQNFIEDSEAGPVGHPSIADLFGDIEHGRYASKQHQS